MYGRRLAVKLSNPVRLPARSKPVIQETGHNFQPGMVLGDLPMAWCQCGFWMQVRPSEFKHLFGQSFRRFKSEYRKSHYLGKGVWKVELPQITIGSCR